MEDGKIKVWLPAIRAGSGADVYTRRLAAGLERRGIVAEITWFPKSHELLPILLRRTQPPDGTNLIITNSWSGFAFKRFHLPLVVVVHHCVFDNKLRPYKSWFQYLYHRLIAEPREVRSLRTADAVVAVSHCVANHLRQKLSMEKVEVIYNWVDTDLFKPRAMEARKDGVFRLLFVGRPSVLKGGDLLVPLMRKLGTDFELRLTVEPEDCQKMKLQDNMISIGRLEECDMVRAYQECDAVLVPSRAEGFGYVALEAMACGKPVITSNNTALPEVVADGVTGILCDADDTEALVNACRRLAKDASLCWRIGEAGRARAQAQFAEQPALRSYLHLIERFVEVGEKG